MTVRRALLFLFLSAVIARPASATPGAATLLTPNGDVTGSTIAFSWQSVPESTWYLLWLGTPSPSALVHQQWYTAEQAGCLGGGTCTITLTPPLVANGYLWFIETWGGGSAGPWSAGKSFTFRDPTPTWSRVLPDGRRFTLMFNDQGVLDNETGLVWERTPLDSTTTWVGALGTCLTVRLGDRFGWRLATIEELSTLGEGTANTLPAGHPFQVGVTNPRFWSQTVYADGPNVLAWGLGSIITQQPKTDLFRVWCVRAPTAATR